MRKKLYIVFIAFVSLLLLLSVTAILLYWYTPVVDRAVLKVINRLVQEDVYIDYDDLSGNLLGTIRLTGLQVVMKGDTLTSPRVELDYSFLNVLRRRYWVRRLDISQPRLILHPDTAVSQSAARPLDSLLLRFKPENLPNLRIDHLRVREGEVFVKRPSQIEHFSHLEVQLSGEILRDQLTITPQMLRGKWNNRDLELQGLAFQLTGNPQRVTLNQIEARLSGGIFRGKAELEFAPRPRVLVFPDTARLELSLLQRFFPELPYREGYVSLSGYVAGLPEAFSGRAQLRGELDDYVIRRAAFEVTREGTAIAVNELRIDTNFGELQGSANLSTEEKSTFSLRFRQIDLQPLDLWESPTRISGRAEFELAGLNRADLNGRGEVLLEGLRLGPVRVDTVYLNLSVQENNWRFLPPSHVTVAKGSKFALRGSISRRQHLALDLETNNNDLTRLASRLSLAGIGGTGSLNLKLQGDLADPSLSGTMFIDSLTYQNSVVYGIEGTADIQNILKNRRGSFDLNVATGYLGDVFLTSGEVNFRFNRNRIEFAPLQFYSEENSIFSQGYLEVQDSGAVMVLDSLALEYENYAIGNDQTLTMRLRGDSLLVETFSLRGSEAGRISARGVLDLGGSGSSLTLQLGNVRLEPFNQYLYWDYLLQGTVDAEMGIFGDLDNPEIDLLCFLNDLSIDRQPLGKVQGDFSVIDKRLIVNVISYESPSKAYLDVNGSIDVLLNEQGIQRLADVPLNLNVVFGDLQLQDYQFLYEVNYPIAGNMTGRLDVRGSLANPRANLNLTAQEVRYGDYYFPDLTLRSRMDTAKIYLEEANVNFLNTRIQASGEKNIRWNPGQLDSLFADKHFRLQLAVREDSLNFLNVINPELERLTGDIQLTALLAGDYDQPAVVDGTVRVAGGKLYLSRIEDPLRDISFSGHLEENTLIIDQLSGRSPEPLSTGNFFKRWLHKIQSLFFPRGDTGDIAVQGKVDLNDLTRPKLDLRATLDDAYFNYFIENTTVVTSSKNLRISGRDTILVTGDVQVSKGEIEFDFAESEKNLLLVESYREEPPFLAYNLSLEILPGFKIRSNETLNSFDMNLSGNLRIIQEPRSLLEMYGTLETSGKYYIQSEDFDIQSGRIDFVNPKELPEVNLTAQTRKNNLSFLLNVRGRLNAPEKEIVIQDEQGNTLPIRDVKDQMALLLFGVTFDRLGSEADEVLLTKGEEVLTQAVVTTIEREARTFTGLDQIRLDAQDSFFKSRLNQPTTLSLGKYLTPQLYLEYRSRLASSGLGNVPAPQLTWEAGNQIYLQYRLNRNWSFSTFYQKTLEGDDRVQFDVRWQLDF